MTTQEKAIYLSEKFKLDYNHAFEILVRHYYDLKSASDYCLDMENGELK